MSGVWLLALAVVAAGEGATNGGSPPAAAEELPKVAAAHRNLKAFDLRIDVWLGSNGTTEPRTATLQCDHQARCLRVFEHWTTLDTPGLSLMVDARERAITVTRGKAAPANGWPTREPDQMLQAWLERGGKVSGGETTPEGRRWTFERPDAAGPPAAVYVDEHTHLLRRLVYGGAEPGSAPAMVDIRYTWGDASRLDPSAFDVAQFVQEQDGAMTGAKAYAGYRIIQTDRH